MKLSVLTDFDLKSFPDDCFEILNNLEQIISAISVSKRKGAGAKIHKTAVLEGSVYVGPGAIIKPHAYIRGPVYIGANCVVGHCTEIKNSVLLDGAKAPHFNYVGDSILCKDVNLGAGTKIANVRLDGEEIRICHPHLYVADKDGSPTLTNSGRVKLGALIGDGVKTGCNAVLSPGTILTQGTLIPPCTHVKFTK